MSPLSPRERDRRERAGKGSCPLDGEGGENPSSTRPKKKNLGGVTLTFGLSESQGKKNRTTGTKIQERRVVFIETATGEEGEEGVCGPGWKRFRHFSKGEGEGNKGKGCDFK